MGKDVVRPQRNAERAPNGRWLPGVAPEGARPWKPGVSANPGGKGGLYHEMQRLAREFTPEATRYLIEIASNVDEDTRNRIVAMSMLLDRAWGKPREYDPASEREPSAYDLSRLTQEQCDQIREAMMLLGQARVEPAREPETER